MGGGIDLSEDTNKVSLFRFDRRDIVLIESRLDCL